MPLFQRAESPMYQVMGAVKNLQAPYGGHGRCPLFLVDEVSANSSLHVVTNEKLRSMVTIVRDFCQQVFQMKGYACTQNLRCAHHPASGGLGFVMNSRGHRESPNCNKAQMNKLH
jgi:hypothetical protein